MLVLQPQKEVFHTQVSSASSVIQIYPRNQNEWEERPLFALICLQLNIYSFKEPRFLLGEHQGRDLNLVV